MSAHKGFAAVIVVIIFFLISLSIYIIAQAPWIGPSLARDKVLSSLDKSCRELNREEYSSETGDTIARLPTLSQRLGLSPAFGEEVTLYLICADKSTKNTYFISFTGTVTLKETTPIPHRVSVEQPPNTIEKVDETTNWNPFTNPQKTFTLMLPPNWKQTSTLSDPFYRKFFFGGPEGTLEVLYGSGLGGGCDNWSKIQIKTQSINACYSTEADNSENIGASTVYQEQGFSISAKINAPYKENEKITKDIFASIDLIGTEQFN